MSATSSERDAKCPAHVPSELWWDNSLANFARESDDPFLKVSQLHAGPELIYASGMTRGRPGWVPTSFSVLEQVFLHAEDFSSGTTNDATLLLGVDWKLNPLEIDPPEHSKYRRILQPLFQPSAVSKLEDYVRQTARELIVRFEDKGSCEFIGDFASLFPSYIFLELMGLPKEMLPQFLTWETSFMRGETLDIRITAVRSIKDYLEAYIEQRGREPRRDDLVDTIMHAEVDGRNMTRGEVMGMCFLLYLGGLDTVLSSLGWHYRYLASHPELQQQLIAEPSLIPGAVDDFLRAFGVTGTYRTVMRDRQLAGVQLKQGDLILVGTYLACRDARQYSDPDRVDPLRKARHLSLATGPHNCLGVHLARLELRVVLEEFLSRFRNIRIPEGEEASWHTDGVWGVDRLPLTWDR